MPKQSAKNRYNFLLDSSVYEEFSLLCEELGYVRSKKVEHFLQAFIQQHQKELEEIQRRKK